MKDSYDAIEKIRSGGSTDQNKKVLLHKPDRAEQLYEQQVCGGWGCLLGVYVGGIVNVCVKVVNLCVCNHARRNFVYINFPWLQDVTD